MISARQKVLQSLWRGDDPCRSELAAHGTSDLQGWGSQHRYLAEGIERIRPTVIVEVGVWKGGSTIHMASKLRDLAIDGVIIAVDTWQGAWDHWTNDKWFGDINLLQPSRGLFTTFLKNVKDAGLEDFIVPVPLDSVNAAQVLRFFDIRPDIVHIDAGHDYAAVMSDIRHWWPALQPGGLLIGDDYRAGNDWPGVKRAFDDYFRPLGLLPLENIDDKCRVSKSAGDLRISTMSSRLENARTLAAAWRETCRIEFAELAENMAIGLEEKVRRYVRFGGPKWEPTRNRIMNEIAAALSDERKQLHRRDVFGNEGEIKDQLIQLSIPDFSTHYLRASPVDELDRFELLGKFKNRLAAFALPSPLNINMAKADGGPLVVRRAYSTDLFLTPLGYQLFREAEGIYWPAASTRTYPAEAMDCPRRDVKASVILIQDIFEGSNFAHFLLDWLPRLGHFLNAGIEKPSSCLFVLGGAPSELHGHLIRAVCDLYDLSEDQFVFPIGPEVWRIDGPAYFFSDAKEATLHPAHMAHRRSIAIVREICAQVATPRERTGRIYISRNDTPLRRVSNEAALLQRLRPLGFTEVRLASIPILEQIKIVRGADIIVAPHGMGLTHIAFHEGRPLVVELHNASLGTDAYAVISRALGFRYHAILGTDDGESGHHFSVDPNTVLDVLAQEGVAGPPDQSRPVMASGPIRSRFIGGVQSIKAAETDHVETAESGDIVYRHVRDDSNEQPDNNVGWLEVGGLLEGGVYHCISEVWLPANFNGGRVALECSNFGALGRTEADITKTGQWQSVSIVGVAKKNLANFVLRCDAQAGAFLYSSKWRSGPGSCEDLG